MVEIRDIKDKPVELWREDENNFHTLIGTIDNLLQFDDVRIQIAREKANGYYVLLNDIKVSINEYGMINHWPVGLFDIQNGQLDELIGLSKKSLMEEE